MKKITSLFLILFSGSTIPTFSQTTLVLQPDSVLGKDAELISNYPDSSFGVSRAEMNALAWTASSTPYIHRSLIEFDLSSVPATATVVSATLTLYFDPTSSNGVQHSQLSGSNAAWLRRVTAPWQENTVTWNNQPGYTTTNEVSIPASSSPTQDYIIDVTALVQDMVNNPSTSFGFILMLQTEQYYRALLFASSDHSNTALHPKLEITYAACDSTLILQPDSALGNDAELVSNYPDSSFGVSRAEMNALAWTASSTPYVHRSLMEFDLSSVPSTTTVQSAALTLYFDPTSSNGIQHSQLSGSNAAWLRRVTSPWQENTVTWNNQPSYATTNEVSVPASSSPTQDYVIDVTALVQDMVNNPSTSFGFILMLQTEQYYRALLFASSDHPNSALHPKLAVCYSAGASVNDVYVKEDGINIFPNPATSELRIENAELKIKEIEIYNALGEKVLSQQQTTNHKQQTIDVSQLPSSIYFITVTDQAGNKVTRKVVKM